MHFLKGCNITITAWYSGKVNITGVKTEIKNICSFVNMLKCYFVNIEKIKNIKIIKYNKIKKIKKNKYFVLRDINFFFFFFFFLSNFFN